MFQVEELALNSMIRKSNSDARLQTDTKSQDLARSHTKHKETTHTNHKQTKVSVFIPLLLLVIALFVDCPRF